MGMSLAAFDALSEAERGLWVARHQQASEKCQRCGFPRSVCEHADKVWYPQRRVCYATMEQQAAQAKWERLHADLPWHDGTFTSWAKEPSADHPCHYSHGVTIYVADTDLNPDDNFLSPPSLQGVDEIERGEP